MLACGQRFLTGTCVREAGHEPPHRDASGCEWRGVSSADLLGSEVARRGVKATDAEVLPVKGVVR